MSVIVTEEMMASWPPDARAVVRLLQKEIAELKAEVAELKARLNTNASNSSLPPSANPLHAAKPVRKKKSKRKRGGQFGHRAHLKQLLPADRVTRTKDIVPTTCVHCEAALLREAGPDDPEPKRFQKIELPKVAVKVIEYRAHGRTCPDCGGVTQAVIPAAVRRHSIGPRLTAVLSYLSGGQGISKRGVEEIAEVVFGAPVSLGTVANLEQEVSAALAPAHREAVEAVRRAAAKHADETSWKLWGKLCWLWAAATANVAAFVIHAKRNATGLAALLGDAPSGIVHSDRWLVYLQVPEERRQLCWAHLKRDFQKVIDNGGPSVFVGRRGRRYVKDLFAAWRAFRAGTITRLQLRELIAPLQERMSRTLVEGALGADPRVARFCVNLLELESALWTFVTHEGVEQTNNHMERLLRTAVLWRRRSFGSNSDAGCRFAERILTVIQTCRLRVKNPLEFLRLSVHLHRKHKPTPRLLA